MDPSTSRPYSLAHQILRDKLATLQKLNSSDALPRDLEGTALFIRGQAVDKFIDDELCATLHAMRRALVKNGKGAKIPRLQVVDLGELLSCKICHLASQPSPWNAFFGAMCKALFISSSRFSLTYLQCLKINDAGCGLSTRPWALPGLSDVTWYDLDLPDVLAFKRDLLSSAGAQLEAFPAHVDLHNHPQNSTSNETTKQNNASAGNNGSPDNLSRPAHPLLTATYVQIEADLVAQDSSLWVSQLESGGWDPHAPTVWLMVALVYYLSPADAKALMERVASVAGAAGSSQALIGTIMNQVRKILSSSCQPSHIIIIFLRNLHELCHGQPQLLGLYGAYRHTQSFFA